MLKDHYPKLKELPMWHGQEPFASTVMSAPWPWVSSSTRTSQYSTIIPTSATTSPTHMTEPTSPKTHAPTKPIVSTKCSRLSFHPRVVWPDALSVIAGTKDIDNSHP